MSTKLKIKIKSLAAEARFIQVEEQKAKRVACWDRAHGSNTSGASDLRSSLHEHRVGVVRTTSRQTLLAYGYLKGKKYSELESSVRKGNDPDWPAVGKMVKRYGTPDQQLSFEAWHEGA